MRLWKKIKEHFDGEKRRAEALERHRRFEETIAACDEIIANCREIRANLADIERRRREVFSDE